MPAFVRAFLFKSSPDGELSYYIKKRMILANDTIRTYQLLCYFLRLASGNSSYIASMTAATSSVFSISSTITIRVLDPS